MQQAKGMGGRSRAGSSEMTWFWGASSSRQGVLVEKGLNPANPFSAHTYTRTHEDVFIHVVQYILYKHSFVLLCKSVTGTVDFYLGCFVLPVF